MAGMAFIVVSAVALSVLSVVALSQVGIFSAWGGAKTFAWITGSCGWFLLISYGVSFAYEVCKDPAHSTN